MSDPIMRQFQELSMQRTFTFATREAGPPTWGQLKKLTQEAEKTLQKAGQPLNPTNLLLAMMAVVTCQSTCAGEKGNNRKKKLCVFKRLFSIYKKRKG
nr:pyrin domain-containing protein 3-like isoform X2 [Ovis aries]